MECKVQLKSLERIDERSVATFTITAEAVGTIEVPLTVEAASGHEASALARRQLQQFAQALLRALDQPNRGTVA